VKTGLVFLIPDIRQLLTFAGKQLRRAEDSITSIVTSEIRKTVLETYRRKFPVWMDADEFKIL
jgi:hypothetical protein